MNYLLVIENFSNWIELNFYLSLILFFIFIVFYSILSLPGLIIFFVFAGFTFGVILSYFICIASFTIGCLGFFIFSKFILIKYFLNKFTNISNKINKFINKSSLEYLIIFRLIPGTPLMIQNLAISFLNISYYKFILSTLIGSSPYIIFSILIGNKLNNLQKISNITSKDVFTLDLLLILIFFILLLLSRIFYKQMISK